MPKLYDFFNKQFIFTLNVIMFFFQAAMAATNEQTNVQAAEHKAEKQSKMDSTMILAVIGLLIATVLTIWLFKVKRFRIFHETGVCMIYGVLAGLIINYSGGVTRKGFSVNLNVSDAPKTIWAQTNKGDNYSYSLTGVLHKRQIAAGGELETMAVFDPEIFFYALLPPIIFFAGFDMKKRFFFRNLGAILTYAFLGTTISCVVFGSLMYAFVSMFADKYPGFTYQKSLLFGSLISATDPVTVLAIFHDLHVDVDLYAIVFGESVMNDAVAIVLYRSIQEYELETFDTLSFFKAIGEFVGVFGGSFLLGSVMGLFNALLSKMTRIGEFPQLETALFTLMSYSTFLIAESCSLTGIVAVLFCGISQAHYTFNNLSPESKVATKEVFGLLNFLAENFIFSYMGLTVFTFEHHRWDPGFIAWAFLAVAISRFCNIYPLSFIMNLGRKKKIPYKFQHMLFFAGLRGAVAFALAIRNTEGLVRQLMLTTVLIVSMVTVIFNGGLTTQALLKLGIRVNVDPDEEMEKEIKVDRRGQTHEELHYDKSWLVRKWHEFDVKFMKPLFTHRGGELSPEHLPGFCAPVASCLGRSHTRFENTDDRYETNEIVAEMDEVNSVDDDMIDVAMVKPPSRSVSQEDSANSNPSNINKKSTTVELHVVS